ncbi:MAG: magnesium protoporphyrin IX methyltransferase [Rhodobacteraceae bacterium]|jgi:magnesium-protoporphyrin O-methyltransferase|nr:magnesium protoporphyrin IX methyltransferase [Paracoccaceae bacterium]
MSYDRTLASVETYFDKTATRTWERLTSDAPVSRIRETVRRGRDAMRAQMLARLPDDLRGARILDAGCGAGQMTAELAARGADVVAVDISPSLVGIARQRLPVDLASRVDFRAGDMLADELGRFDHVMAMDSLIYYSRADLAAALHRLSARVSGGVVFTVAPRTPLLMAMWRAGQLFPRSDRSPTMVPHAAAALQKALAERGAAAKLSPLDRITSGFYISQALELRP